MGLRMVIPIRRFPCVTRTSRVFFHISSCGRDDERHHTILASVRSVIITHFQRVLSALMQSDGGLVRSVDRAIQCPIYCNCRIRIPIPCHIVPSGSRESLHDIVHRHPVIEEDRLHRNENRRTGVKGLQPRIFIGFIGPVGFAERRFEPAAHHLHREHRRGLARAVDGTRLKSDAAGQRTVLEVVVAILRTVTAVVARRDGTRITTRGGLHVAGIVTVLQTAGIAPTDHTAHTFHAVHDARVVAVAHFRDGGARQTAHLAAVNARGLDDAVVEAPAQRTGIAVGLALRIVGNHIAHDAAHILAATHVATVVAVENLRVEGLSDQTADMLAAGHHHRAVASGEDTAMGDGAVTVTGNGTDIVLTVDAGVIHVEIADPTLHIAEEPLIVAAAVDAERHFFTVAVQVTLERMGNCTNGFPICITHIICQLEVVTVTVSGNLDTIESERISIVDACAERFQHCNVLNDYRIVFGDSEGEFHITQRSVTFFRTDNHHAAGAVGR